MDHPAENNLKSFRVINSVVFRINHHIQTFPDSLTLQQKLFFAENLESIKGISLSEGISQEMDIKEFPHTRYTMEQNESSHHEVEEKWCSSDISENWLSFQN
ncbi:hypothetical protein ILYODFUR_027154 [Ilyodon furcidens]|uniref:Uncharacterized protein n=1 Tax=Ilyodon furcidens TaxID=33524 RepID=A0ABV0T286_9TELE